MKTIKQQNPEWTNQSIKLKQTNRDVLFAINDYLMTQKLRLEPLTVWKILKFGKYYQIDGIMWQCIEYLSQNITEHNCVLLWRWLNGMTRRRIDQGKSKTLNESFCIKQVETFVCANFEKISRDNFDLYRIDLEPFRLLLDQDRLNIHNETQIWWSIIRWVRMKPSEREILLPKLLPVLRMGRLKLHFIESTILEHEMIKKSTELKTTINEMIHEYKMMRMNATKHDGYGFCVSKTNKSFRPRVPRSIIFLFGGWVDGDITNMAEVYDLHTNQWFTNMMPENVVRTYAGMELYQNNQLYFIGGSNGIDYLQTVLRYDLITGKSERMASMHSIRCYVSTTILNGTIYALGGHNGEIRLNTAERYDIETNQWTMIQPMNTVRSDAAAVTFAGKIIVAGGVNLDRTECSVEQYDPQTDEWEPLPPMNYCRSSFTMVVYHGMIYAIGGRTGGPDSLTRTVECFDYERKLWLTIDRLKLPRCTFKSTVFDDKIYVMNGYDGRTTLKSIETYDYRNKCWIKGCSNNYNRSAFNVITIDSLPNVEQYTYNGKE